MIYFTIATLIVAFLTLLASTTSIFKRRIPVNYGFVYDNKIVDSLNISSGDPEKPIGFRIENRKSHTLTDLIIDIKILRPLSLSATKSALAMFGQTRHGPSKNNEYYSIRYFDILLYAKQEIDFTIELNTTKKKPGSYLISTSIYSKNDKYRFKNFILNIKIS